MRRVESLRPALTRSRSNVVLTDLILAMVLFNGFSSAALLPWVAASQMAIQAAAIVSPLAANRIPIFDIGSHCRDVAQRAAPIGDKNICVRQEQRARNELAQQWDKFTAADRQHCLNLTRMGEPTYTQLLTCLELARDARRLRERSTTGVREVER
jgi:hypothetical protein